MQTLPTGFGRTKMALVQYVSHPHFLLLRDSKAVWVLDRMRVLYNPLNNKVTNYKTEIAPMVLEGDQP